jgi:hypothetical protein
MQCDMGLDAVFYDRRHKREVRSSQLCVTRLVVPLVAADPHDPPTKFEFDKPESEYDIPLMWSHDLVIGDLGYRSPDCPNFKNWDMDTSINDLVFLRFEELPGTKKD